MQRSVRLDALDEHLVNNALSVYFLLWDALPVPSHGLSSPRTSFAHFRSNLLILPGPSSSRVTSISQAEKLLSLSLDYNISLSPQQLADASAFSSCAYRNNVGCETPSPPCKYLCGIFVYRVCVSSGHHCNTSATQHLLIFHKVRCGVRAGVLLPYPSQAFVAAGRLRAMRCPLTFVHLSSTLLSLSCFVCLI
jgi:hypothetical protein